jgi:hypothetical protein
MGGALAQPANPTMAESNQATTAFIAPPRERPASRGGPSGIVGASAVELLLENQPCVLAKRVGLDRRSGSQVRYPRCAGE